MASVRFTDVQARPTEFLDFTSLTLDEFQQLVPPFEVAFQAHMAAWRLDGQPRTARQFAVYKNCPLPTPEDRLLFILAYVKTYSLQVVQGRLFSMEQSKANQWIHVLFPALLAALRTLGDAPTRSLTALTQRLGVAEAQAWRGTLEAPPRFAPRFYAVIAVAMLVGVALDYVGFNAVKMLFWSAVLNGVLAPPLIVLVILLTSNPAIMGTRGSSPLLRVLEAV